MHGAEGHRLLVNFRKQLGFEVQSIRIRLGRMAMMV